MAFPKKQDPLLATQVAVAFLNDAGPLGCGHRLLHHNWGLLRGHGDTKVDAGLLAQVDTTQRLPREHDA